MAGFSTGRRERAEHSGVHRRYAGKPVSGYAVALALVVVVSACGGEGSDDPGGVPSGTVSPQTSMPMEPPGSPTAPESGDLGEPVKTTRGEIVIAAASRVFEVGEPVTATVSNGTDEIIYVENLHTGCSFAVLQRNEDQWVPLPDCGSERKAAVLAIGPGRGRTVEIDPQSLKDVGAELDAGTYRLEVGWRKAPGPEGVVDERSYSNPFEVR